MEILILQHAFFEEPGYIDEYISARGDRMHRIRVYEGESFPPAASYDIVIILGGPMGVYDAVEYPWLAAEKVFIRSCIDAGMVVLGICLGAQLLADALGAKVYKNNFPEIGWFPVHRAEGAVTSTLGNLLPAAWMSFHWHGDTFEIPSDAVLLGSSDACRNQGFVWNDRVIGLQFHNEMTADSLGGMCRAAGNDISSGGYVQSVEEIMQTDFLDDIHAVMDIILGYCFSMAS